MRIGLDAKRIFHNFRGLGNYSRTLVEGLCNFHPDNHYTLYSPAIKDDRGVAWLKKYPQIEVVTPDSTLAKQFSTVWRSVFLSNVLERGELDIFHGLSHELPPGVKKRSFKTVVTVHDLIFLRFPEFFPWIDRQVYMRKLKYSCEVADVILSICEQTKRDLMEFLSVPEERIRVIYQTCNVSFYARTTLEQRESVLDKYGLPGNYILYVGALERRKNVLNLVKAFSRISSKTDYQLVLVGQGKEDYKNEILRVITEAGLLERTKILESVPTEDLPMLYSSAMVFVFPSFFEGWGLPIVEALFSEVPVITSKGSCFAEAGGESTIYVDPHSVEDLAIALDDLLNQPELRESMIRVGRDHAEKFHWQNTSRQINDLYSSLI